MNVGKRRHAGTATLAMKEVQVLFGYERSAVYRMARDGTLPVRVIRAGRRLLVSRQEVEHLLGAEAVARVVDGGPHVTAQEGSRA